MPTLSQIDPHADIACTLPINEAGGRLDALQALVGDRLASAERDASHLTIRINRAGDDELERHVTEWARAEKGCCGFLGFSVESDADFVTLEIASPQAGVPTLDAIAWMFRAADRAGAA